MAHEAARNIIWRPLGRDDVSHISQWFWDFKDVAMFDRTLPVPVSAEALEDSWKKSFEHKRNPCAHWFVAVDENVGRVGVAGLDSVNYIMGDAVLPFFVSEGYRKQGLATVMAISLLDLAFTQLRLHRVTTYYRSDNVASQRILEKLGFSEEGRVREGWFADGVRKDIVGAGILATEWMARRDKVIEGVTGTCDLSFSPTCWKVKRE